MSLLKYNYTVCMCIGICRRAPTWGLSKYTKTKFMCWALTESLFSAAQSQQPQKKLEKREKSGNKIASLTFLGTVIKFMSSQCFWEGGFRIKGGKWVHEERGGGVGIRKNVCMKRVKNNREVGGRLWPKPTSLQGNQFLLLEPRPVLIPTLSGCYCTFLFLL